MCHEGFCESWTLAWYPALSNCAASFLCDESIQTSMSSPTLHRNPIVASHTSLFWSVMSSSLSALFRAGGGGGGAAEGKTCGPTGVGQIAWVGGWCVRRVKWRITQCFFCSWCRGSAWAARVRKKGAFSVKMYVYFFLYLPDNDWLSFLYVI